MSALVKNHDLVPDPSDGKVGREQTRQEMMRVGIHEAIATETTDANFKSALCETCPERINLFEMNTIRTRLGSSPAGEPHEHFRSTGIRDGNVPNGGAWGFAELCCLGGSFGPSGAWERAPAGPPLGTWTLKENRCLARVWDNDKSNGMMCKVMMRSLTLYPSRSTDTESQTCSTGPIKRRGHRQAPPRLRSDRLG